MIIFLVKSEDGYVEGFGIEGAFTNRDNALKFNSALKHDCSYVEELEVMESFTHPEVLKNNEKIASIEKSMQEFIDLNNKKIKELWDKNLELMKKGA